MKVLTQLRAFTKLDLVIVIAMTGLLAIWLLGYVRLPQRPRGTGVNCLSNLKQVGLGFRMWEADHEERFPWSVSTNEGGTLEFAATKEVFRHFLAASNELNSPNILVCPIDRERIRTNNFADFANENLSYFVATSVTNSGMGVLSGDRHLSVSRKLTKGIIVVSNAASVRWVAGELHKQGGNLGFADGSVTSSTNLSLIGFLTNLPIRLAIP